ncbi:unnamed protein product [Lymnaea stagnalis]|uniref:C-type lectin domain-containing protein n=1 Tax=Lymnaea stagnalis TaxID=6523 RepID=A0AAV2I4K1_LYMST
MDHLYPKAMGHLVMLAAVFHYSESTLSVSANPEIFNPGLTTKLTVKCNYVKNDTSTSSPSALVSLFLSRANNGSSDYEEFASLNVFLGQQVNLITQENVKASGAINSTGESFIALTWDSPAEDVAGSYKCTAQGPDHVGHSVVIESTVDVKSSAPGNKDLLSQIQQLDSHLKQVEATINLMKTDFAGQLVQVSKNDTHVLALNDQTAQDINTLKQANANSSSANMKLLLEAFRSSVFSREFNGPNATYWLSKNSYTDVRDAENLCKLYKGYLVEINSDGEYAAVREFLNRLDTEIYYVYVGATDERAENQWVYRSDGTPVQFTDWAINQPRPGPDYNCMFMEESLGWRMSAYRCTSLTPIYALCELS